MTQIGKDRLMLSGSEKFLTGHAGKTHTLLSRKSQPGGAATWRYLGLYVQIIYNMTLDTYPSGAPNDPPSLIDGYSGHVVQPFTLPYEEAGGEWIPDPYAGLSKDYFIPKPSPTGTDEYIIRQFSGPFTVQADNSFASPADIYDYEFTLWHIYGTYLP